MLREKLFGKTCSGGGAAAGDGEDKSGAVVAPPPPPPPIFLLNDADAALAAEVWCGAARGQKNVVMLTLGTGVGTAVMLNGKPWVGARGLVEAGHMIIEKDGRLCGCGQRGCLEMYTSATAVVRRANEVGLRIKMKVEGEEEEGRRRHAVSGESDGGGVAISNAKQVFDAAFPPPSSSPGCTGAGKADPLALQVIEEVTDYLSLGCVNVCRMLDPDLLLFAGGMSGAPATFWLKLKEGFAKYGWAILPHEIEMSVAALGGDRAGVLGAVWAAWRGV
jgi:glucokinase